MENYAKKNNTLKKVLKNKIDEILENPNHYKPLKYGLAGERRVHILKSFVLKYCVDKERKSVMLLFFGHHDEAYKR